MRNYAGTQMTVESFDRLYVCCIDCYSSLQDTDYFGWFIVTYCNLLYEADHITKAINITADYLQHTRWNKSLDDEQKTIKGYLHNREHVYRRALAEYPFDNRDVIQALEDCDAIARTFSSDEIQYVNHTDYGYCGYALHRHKYHVLHHWKTAMAIFEHSNIPQKTMNYYTLKIQVTLIGEQAEYAAALALEAISYSHTGNDVYYFSYFTVRL